MYKRFLRVISLILAIVVFIQTTSIFEIVASATTTTNEASNEITVEPEIIGEDTSKREESVKHFRMSDGTFLAVSYSQPVHYRTENGSWQDIDNTLKEAVQQISVPLAAMDSNDVAMASSDGSVNLSAGAYVNTSNDFQVSLPETMNTQSWVGTFHKGRSLFFRFENIGQSVAVTCEPELQGMSAFEQATSVPTSSSVSYENILPGVNVVYQLSGQQLKENILFSSLANTPESMSFILWAEDLVLTEQEDGSYYFTEDGQTYFVLPAPYMVDGNGESGGAVQVSVEEVSEDTYRFTYVPDRQWLQSADRVWPVVLDPVTCATATAGTIEDVYARSGYPQNAYYLESFIYAGYFSAASKNVRSFVQHNATPVLNSGDVVTRAELLLTGRIYESSGAIQVNAYAVTEEWESKYANWNRQPDTESEVLDFQIVDSTAYKTYTWDITSAVQRWYSGDLAGRGELGKYGFMLKAPNDEDSGKVHLAQFYSSDTSGPAKPQLLIYYRNTTGIESYWDYTSASVGRAGMVAVNNYTGNLVVSRTDMSYAGNIMPASMTFTYNTNDYDTNIGYGAGWRINYSQTISLKTISGNDYYCWIDGDGTAIYFYNNEGTWKDENGLSYTLAVTDAGYTITDRDNNKLVFDVDERLTEIIDGKISANKIQIAYVSENKIHTVTDGAGRQYIFGYDDEEDDGNLSSISYMGHGAGPLEIVTYSYLNGQLETVTYADNNSVSYSYENGYLDKAIGCQNEIIEVSYGSGSPARVKDITSIDAGTIVSSASFLYGDNYTKVADNNGRWCIYQFNNHGNTVSVYNQRGQALYGSYSDATPNQLVNSSRLQDTVTNLLSTRNYTDSWIASVTVEAGKTYTLSGEGSGVLTLATETASKTSDIISGGRTEVTITIPVGITTATISGSSDFSNLQFEQTEAASRYNMLFDTDMTAVSSWMGTNTNTEDGQTSMETGVRAYLDNFSLLINGEPTKAKQYTQTISVSGESGDNYSFGAWVKAASVALDNTNSQNDTDPERRFGIQVRLLNGSTVVAEEYIAANEACAEWQFISGSVQANAAYSTVEISLIYDYNANEAYFDGAQLFKEKFAYVYTYDENGRISTVADLEGNVTEYEYRGDSSDIVKITLPGEGENKPVYTYSYHENTNLLTGMTSATGIRTSMEYDVHGNNEQTVVTYADNTGAVMQSNQTYTDNDNFLHTVTGTDRNTITYTYDPNTSTLTSVTDAKNVVTANEYDVMRRPLKTTTGNASVSYAYDADRLASTYHTGGTNGTTYRFAYTTMGLTDTISIRNGETGGWTLVDNAYNSGTWTLASQTYGNGDAWHYEYNEFDEVVRAHTTGGETGTELQYFYNSEGALARIEQYATTLSGSMITGRTWVSTERYYYDSSDRATRITRQDADGDSYECHWEYDHNDNVTNLVEVVNGQTHTTAYTYDADQRISALTASGSTASYTYDGFGRLSSQVTKYGESAILTEGYTFLTVERTEVEDDGTSKKVEYATSQIDTLMLNAAGFDRTYEYEYDANGNIISVTVRDTATDEATTTKYTYDTLNQLVREDNQAVEKTWIYTYDNGGNILLKKEYNYTTEDISLTDADVPNYVYDNEHWGDLLTIYNGVEIAYDGIGNPLNDGTWEYTWENGRQLASICRRDPSGEYDETISYTYNADGLRTGKIVKVDTYDVHSHSYATAEVEPTCTTKGYTLHTCQCGDSYKDNYVPALGHSYLNRRCTRCGASIGSGIEIPVVPEPKPPIEVASEQTSDMLTGMENSAEAVPVEDAGNRTLSSTVVTEYDYIYSGSHLIQLTITSEVNDGTPTNQTMYFTYDANGFPMTITFNGDTYFYATNLQGDVIAILDSSGEAVVEYSYDAWGNILTATDTTLGNLNPLRYRGYVYDAESTLYYLQSRYYDPEMGRFINADAFASTGQDVLGNNMFAYCGNNPVMYNDALGMARNVCMTSLNLPGSLYIYDQEDEPFDDIPYGIGSIGENGCGVIATYNAMISLGDIRTFGEIYSYLTSDSSKMLADGNMGTNPWAIADYFESQGYTVHSTYNRDEIELYSTVADACILLYTFKTSAGNYGGHYVEYSRTPSGYTGRNVNTNTGMGMFSHPSDYGYEGERFFVLGIFVFK